MKTDTTKKLGPHEGRAQTAAPTKKQAGVKHKRGISTPVTDTVKNTATQTPGRNEAKTSREDLLPLD